MTPVSNLAVERSITFSNLKLHYIKCEEGEHKVDEYPITAESIEKEFQKDIDNGLIPTLFITSLGSTSSLSIENIEEIAKACKKYDVWLHVDAAHLGVYGLVPEHRYILNDIEHADSFTTNGHKSLGCGMGTSFLWIKDHKYPEWISYNSEQSEEEGGITSRSSFFMTPPSKIRAVRTMIHLLSIGKKGIIEAFRKHFTLADHFRNLVLEDDRFELLDTKYKFPLVLFKLKGLTNEQNNEYLKLVMKENKIFMVSSIVHEVMFLRLSVGTFTHEQSHIEETYQYLENKAEEFLSNII